MINSPASNNPAKRTSFAPEQTGGVNFSTPPLRHRQGVATYFLCSYCRSSVSGRSHALPGPTLKKSCDDWPHRGPARQGGRVESCTALKTGRVASLKPPTLQGSDRPLELTCGPAVLLQRPGVREALPGQLVLLWP